MKKIFWCKNCLNMSTRNRIEFDERGWCNACQWMEEKKNIDWNLRKKELEELLSKHRSKNGEFDCLVPVSGGKDGSYVAYNLKHKYNMNPLCITITPPLSLEVGNQNLKDFIDSGYDLIQFNPNVETMRKLNKIGFIKQGRPYYGWLIAVQSIVLQVAMNYKISLVFYGENGEIEYGGSTRTKNMKYMDVDFVENTILESTYQDTLKHFNDKDITLWKIPGEGLFKDEIKYIYWSYFEAWDSYRNYIVAKDYCGLKENENSNSGTFTNFAQNDQALYALHTYLMYLKFGFGRATQDAGIEIRRGAMVREQALNLVKLYDNQYPEEFIDEYLKYYQITKEEFDEVLDKHANKNLFEKIDGRWMPKFEVGEEFYI